MRSFIKSHRRGSSSALEDALEEPTRPIVSYQSSPTLSNSSPVRPTMVPVSPNRGNKLQRLFQRSKSSSTNLLLSPSRASSGGSPPPMIKGTRTHEWGVSPGQLGSSQRISFASDKSSSSSLSSPELYMGNSLRRHSGAEDMLQLPLNTVLEIPDKVSPRKKSKDMKKKMHRRAQIITTSADIPFRSDQEEEEQKMLASPIQLIVPKMGDLGLRGERAVSSETLEQSDNLLKDDMKLNARADDEYQSDESSEFSFELENGPGRNNSQRYYKDPAEVLREKQHVVREQGFYVNDYMEDEFDDDMNYFDEGDNFNDDEELFNKKYFSDEEEPEYNDTNTQRPPLQTARSVKYHHLPVNLEQEFNTHRYSWMSDEDSPKSRPNDSYDSLLDEINDIPDDYDYTDESKPSRGLPTTRSKSMNSALKRNVNFASSDGVQNTKFEAGQKTVTLFTRSQSMKDQTSTSAQPQQHQFSYLTPNNSFTTPSPAFASSNLELSPISEGSFFED